MIIFELKEILFLVWYDKCFYSTMRIWSCLIAGVPQSGVHLAACNRTLSYSDHTKCALMEMANILNWRGSFEGVRVIWNLDNKYRFLFLFLSLISKHQSANENFHTSRQLSLSLIWLYYWAAYLFPSLQTHGFQWHLKPPRPGEFQSTYVSHTRQILWKSDNLFSHKPENRLKRYTLHRWKRMLW